MSARDLRLGQRLPSSRTMTLSILLKQHLSGLRGKHLIVLEWPSQSSDPNPIENLWYDLEIAVQQRNPSNLKEMEQFFIEEWANILVARCAKLTETYPKRLAVVIAAKGGSTND